MTTTTPPPASRWVAATTRCHKCGHTLRVERGTLKPEPCPVCGAVGLVHAAKAKRAGGRDAEDGMARQLVIAGYVDLPAADARTSNDRVFVRQFAWGLYLPEPRKYAADFGFPSRRVLVEVDGGAHYAGRARGAYDTERRGLAASIGWTICPVTPDQVRDGTGIELVKSALAAKEPA